MERLAARQDSVAAALQECFVHVSGTIPCATMYRWEGACVGVCLYKCSFLFRKAGLGVQM